jgi:hypothetical protein
MSLDNPIPAVPRRGYYTVSSVDLETMLYGMLDNDEVQMAYCMNGMVFVIFHGDRMLEGSLFRPAAENLQEDILDRTGNA